MATPVELVPLAPGEAASVPGSAQLRVVGLWSGSLLLKGAAEGALGSCTVTQVREQLSLLSGVPAAGLRIISSGRTLKDRDSLGEPVCLVAVGVRPGSKLLLTKGSAQTAAPGEAPEALDRMPGADLAKAAESAASLRRIKYGLPAATFFEWSSPRYHFRMPIAWVPAPVLS